ncbi:MAG: tetraacyldisaccharide 4'-kinase [Thioalkalivibrionaceae bacterium]
MTDQERNLSNRRRSLRRARMEAALWRFWMRRGLGQTLLWPVSQLYALVVRHLRDRGRAQAARVFVPVRAVVGIGNLTVGGSGKTPATLWLASALRQELAPQGLKVGILTRGYGASASREYSFAERLRQRVVSINGSRPVARAHANKPWSGDRESCESDGEAGSGYWVRADSDPGQVGDEPVLLARRTGLPVRVDRDRVRGLHALAQAGVDVVVADDALQHYRLPLHLRILLVHGARHFGNGLPLPAGPLREPMEGVAPFDAMIRVTAATDDTKPAAPQWSDFGAAFRVAIETEARVTMASRWLSVEKVSGETKQLDPAALSPGTRVHAVAGIADPERFFLAVEALGVSVVRHPFPDHHQFTFDDFAFDDDATVVMTEKDAVKLAYLLGVDAVSQRPLGGFWFWPMMLRIDRDVFENLLTRLEARIQLNQAKGVDTRHDWRDRRLPGQDLW